MNVTQLVLTYIFILLMYLLYFKIKNLICFPSGSGLNCNFATEGDIVCESEPTLVFCSLTSQL